MVGASVCLALGVGASACSESQELGLPPTALVYDGDRLRLFAERDREPCAGEGPALDRALEHFVREFGLGEMDGRADVYWLSEETLASRSPCRALEGAGGCFVDGREAFVVHPSVAEHELTHVYLANRTGRTHAFFEEGIAVVYGRFPRFGPPTSDLRDALQHGESLPAEHYARAGHFVNDLLDEYGPEVMGEFFEEAAGIRDQAGIEPVFFDVFGVSLDVFIERYEAEAPVCGSAGWNRPFECEGDPLPWSRAWAWDYQFSMSCGNEDVVQEYDGRIVTRVAFDVEHASMHTLFLDGAADDAGPDAYRVDIHGCAGCGDSLSFGINSEMGSLSGIPLEAGRYYMDISRDPDVDPDVSVRLQTP